jgi:hypothetical protein
MTHHSRQSARCRFATSLDATSGFGSDRTTSKSIPSAGTTKKVGFRRPASEIHSGRADLNRRHRAANSPYTGAAGPPGTDPPPGHRPNG